VKVLSYDDCIRKGLLKKIKIDQNLVNQTVQMADDDLSEGEESIGKGKFVWGTVQLYTAMLNYSRALLLIDGIRDMSHYCTIEYIKAHYSDDLGISISSFDRMRRERHISLYDSRERISEEMANERLEWAFEFRDEIMKIIEGKK
jgi:uncharacterized protein (UPF0332 family)